MLLHFLIGLPQLVAAKAKRTRPARSCSRVLTWDNASLEAHLWLGAIKLKAGNTAAAIQHFRAAVKLDDTNVPALNNLAYLLAATDKNADEALAFAQRAHELAPDNADTEGTLGWVLYHKRLYKIALQYLQDAVEKDGHSPTRNASLRKYHLGLVYLALGDRESGRNTMNAALRINPDVAKIDYPSPRM